MKTFDLADDGVCVVSNTLCRLIRVKSARDYGENTFIMYSHPNLCIERNTQILNFGPK